MNKVEFSVFFKKALKRFLKKFPSLKFELEALKMELMENPEKGIHITTYLENKIFKIKIASKSKGKGKSGGFRVITYVINEDENSTTINFITIFDKSEEQNIKKSKIVAIIKSIMNK